MKRYRVDRRTGCIAVVRCDVTPSSPGLHRDDAHVIEYWHGQDVTGKIFGMPHVHWHVPGYVVRRARKLAEKLNNKEET